MKKVLIVTSALILLSGCGKLRPLDVTASLNQTIDKETKESYEYTLKKDYQDLFDPYIFSDDENLNAQKKDKLANFTISDITLTQKGQPVEKISVYKDDKTDSIVLTDGASYTLYNGNTIAPKDYKPLIDEFRKQGWYFTGSITGSNINRLDFGNAEYIITSTDKGMFSMQYDNVSLNSNNIPLGLSLYIEEGNNIKLYIKSYSLPYQNKELSLDNINMLREAISLSNINDNDIILNKLNNSIKDNKNESQKLHDFTITTLKPVFAGNGIYHNSMIIIPSSYD